MAFIVRTASDRAMYRSMIGHYVANRTQEEVPARIIRSNLFWSLDGRGFRTGWLPLEEAEALIQKVGDLAAHSDCLMEFPSVREAQEWASRTLRHTPTRIEEVSPSSWSFPQ